MAGWKWEEEELCRSLVERLKRGETLDTRTFLRPVFKWIKQGLRKVGPEAIDAIEKTFAYIEWMVQLSRTGDKERDINPLPNIQPSYALNTVLTSSQRAGKVIVALRSFDMLVAYGYEPDVFAYTALIDVTARTGDVERAIARYEEMRQSNSRPNIVTYTTILRATRYSTKVDPRLCLDILSHARQDQVIDDALYLEAIGVCIIHQHELAMTYLLEEIQRYDARLLQYPILLSQVETFVRVVEDKRALIAKWKENKLFADEFLQRLEGPSEMKSSSQLGNIAANIVDNEPTCGGTTTKVHGCLGFETTASVRHAVVQHDLTRLVERIHRGNNVSHHDFETLIHQCRKRKWSDEIQQIVEAMNDMATKGWYLEQFNAQIPPQPHIAPTRKTFLAVIDAYLCCGDEEMAWKYFIHPLSHGQKRDQLFYRKYIRGCYLLKCCAHVEELLQLVQEQDVHVHFSQRMCVELIRIHGTTHVMGLKVLEKLVQMDAGAQPKLEQLLLEELIKSCAFENNTEGVMDVYKCAARVLGSASFQMEMAVFIACVHADSLAEALFCLRNFQDQQLLFKLPVYDSLLREIYFKYLSFTTNNGNNKEKKKKQKSKKKMAGSAMEPSMSSSTISRDIVFKVLHLRRMIFEKIHQDKTELLTALKLDEANSLAWYCSDQVNSLESAPLMFVQHAVEMITTLRDREAKLQTQEQLCDALNYCEDPLLFVLRTVHSLQYLDLSPRSQGKLAKEILAILPTRSDPVLGNHHHVKYCIDGLESLHVHVVKEIDEIVHLYKSHAKEIVAYCTRVISKDNLDKTLSFLLSRESFYTLEVTSCTSNSNSSTVCLTTSCCLVSRLAELMVFHGLNAVLQYFKHEIGQDYVSMRRRFLRNVWLLENGIEEEQDEGDDEEEDGASVLVLKKPLKAFPKAISELKMEHEEEFLPLLLQIHQQHLHTGDRIFHDDQGNSDFFLTLSLSEDKIIFVDDEEKLLVAYDVLLGDEGAMIKRIALDVEWRPESRTGGLTSKCSIVQVACDTHVFIFDVLHLMQEFEELFSTLLGSKEIEKIGFGLDGDFKKLRESFPEVACFDNILTVRDFSIEQENKIKGGLSGYAHHYLGLPLCKYQQKSDWEARPLSHQQLQYAALDAHVLLQIHDKINKTQA